MDKRIAYLGVGPKMDRKSVETLANHLENVHTELFVPPRDVESWGASASVDPSMRMRQRLEAISSCAFYIGEFSYPSRQAFFEAGYAHALGKPIVAIHRPGTKVSAELEAVCAVVIEYEDYQDLMQKMRIGENFGLLDS